MTVQDFGAWYAAQPELIQKAVVFGPPALVMGLIGLLFGNRLLVLLVAWRFGPAAAPAATAWLHEQDNADSEAWTESAKDAVDELIAQRNSGR